MRLIDADALIDDVDGDLTDSVAESIAIEKIENAPTIDAVPVVHGRWEEQTVISNDVANHIDEWQSVRCSVCKRYLTTPYLYYFTNYDYCPQCGAKMGREEKEE